jgi:hypothetical protein
MHSRALSKTIIISASFSPRGPPSLSTTYNLILNRKVYHQLGTNSVVTPFLLFNLPCPGFSCLVAQHHTLPTLFTYTTTKIFLHDIPSLTPPTVALLGVFHCLRAVFSLFSAYSAFLVYSGPATTIKNPTTYDVTPRQTRLPFYRRCIYNLQIPLPCIQKQRRSKVSVWR